MAETLAKDKSICADCEKINLDQDAEFYPLFGYYFCPECHVLAALYFSSEIQIETYIILRELRKLSPYYEKNEREQDSFDSGCASNPRC
jgi:hypothetical protein